MSLYVHQNVKQLLFYASWGLLLIFVLFRYQLWRIFDEKHCSEANLLVIARATLKPDNWLLIAVFVFTVLVSIRVYFWASNQWLWFSRYGSVVVAVMLFTALLLISWSCG